MLTGRVCLEPDALVTCVADAHYYDEKLGLCLSRGGRTDDIHSMLIRVREWLQDRLANEVVLHLFHELGVVRWV